MGTRNPQNLLAAIAGTCAAAHYVGRIGLLAVTEGRIVSPILWLYEQRWLASCLAVILLVLVLALDRFAPSRAVELVLALCFLGEAVYVLRVATLGNLAGFYEGPRLLLVVFLVSLSLILLALTAIGFGFGRPWAGWLLAAYLLLSTVGYLFPIPPNGPEYRREARRLSQLMETADAQSIGTHDARVEIEWIPGGAPFLLAAGGYVALQALRRRRVSRGR